MKVFILYIVIILTFTKNVKLTPIENNEIPLDSISDNDDGNKIDSDVDQKNEMPFNFLESLRLDSSDIRAIQEDIIHVQNGGESYVDDDDDSSENSDDESDIDMKEKLYGISIPVCAQYAGVPYPLHVSHLTDCGKFYKCSNGIGYLFDCPSDQHWSVKFDRCDYLEIAGCKMDGTHQFKLQKKQVKVKQANKKFDEAIDSESFDEFDIDSRCNGNDPFSTIRFSYPNDCTKFYKCHMGKAFINKCPEGQHWGQRLNRCDHPSRAHCTSIKPDELSIAFQYADTPMVHEHRKNIAFDADYIIRDERCKDDDDVDILNPLQFAHPSDCQMFYKCFDKYAYKVSCPSGLQYHTKTRACDYEYNVKCDDGIRTA